MTTHKIKDDNALDFIDVAIETTWYRRLYWKLYGFFKWEVLKVPHRIKEFISRGKRGYSKSDVWDFDRYLAKVISEGVYQLMLETYSHPSHITLNEWQKILSKISRAFSKYNTLEDFYTSYIRKFGSKRGKLLYDKRFKQIKRDMKLFIKYFEHLWD